jgi:hypothetical protein
LPPGWQVNQKASMPVSAVGERYRQRLLSANQKSIEAFFTRQLPPGLGFLRE